MPRPKFYYFIEDLDVTGDNIPDGILVRQFTLNNNIINYKKNNYITEDTLKSILISIKSNENTKSFLLPKKYINLIKNGKVDFNTLPRIIITKNTTFSNIFKNIDIDLFLKELNKLFS